MQKHCGVTSIFFFLSTINPKWKVDHGRSDIILESVISVVTPYDNKWSKYLGFEKALLFARLTF